eukprot:1211101-Rhodomonas_salina.2
MHSDNAHTRGENADLCGPPCADLPWQAALVPPAHASPDRSTDLVRRTELVSYVVCGTEEGSGGTRSGCCGRGFRQSSCSLSPHGERECGSVGLLTDTDTDTDTDTHSIDAHMTRHTHTHTLKGGGGVQASRAPPPHRALRLFVRPHVQYGLVLTLGLGDASSRQTTGGVVPRDNRKGCMPMMVLLLLEMHLPTSMPRMNLVELDRHLHISHADAGTRLTRPAHTVIPCCSRVWRCAMPMMR